MLKPLIRPFIVLAMLFAMLEQVATAQNFIKDYKQYLIENTKNGHKARKSINASVQRLDSTLTRFQMEKGHQFLTGDTLYMVTLNQIETGFSSKLLWNKTGCCYYYHSFSMVNRKVVNQNLEIKTDGSEILKSFGPDFKKWVETADTAGYINYAKKHRVFDGSIIGFTRAIKTSNHWVFVSSKSYATDFF